MTESEIVELVKGAIIKARPDLVAELGAVDIDTRFENLPLDSIDNLQMITFMEDRLGFLFQEEDFGEIETVKDIAGLIAKYSR